MSVSGNSIPQASSCSKLFTRRPSSVGLGTEQYSITIAERLRSSTAP